MTTPQFLVAAGLAGVALVVTVALRTAPDTLFVTDEGNHILDLHLGRIGNARQLSLVLNQVPGVVENGLFVDICDLCITGHADGRIETRDIHSDTVATTPIENAFADLTS